MGVVCPTQRSGRRASNSSTSLEEDPCDHWPSRKRVFVAVSKRCRTEVHRVLLLPYIFESQPREFRRTPVGLKQTASNIKPLWQFKSQFLTDAQNITQKCLSMFMISARSNKTRTQGEFARYKRSARHVFIFSNQPAVQLPVKSI